MYRSSLFLLCFLLVSTVLFAQKDAPVVGNAITLLDLLKKDYNAGDPETKWEELSKDRTQVIAIFKSYLTDELKAGLSSPTYTNIAKGVDASFLEYTSLKKKFTALTAFSGAIDQGEVDSFAGKLKDASEKLEGAKTSYYNGRYELDKLEMVVIGEAFSSLQNEFLKSVMGKFIGKYADLQEGRIDKQAAATPSTSVSKSIIGLGGDFSYQVVIAALSEILAARIKEELSLYATQQIQAWLSHPGQDDPLAEFKVLLPQTTLYFTTYNRDGIFNAKQLREHIESDLKALLKNAEHLRSTPRMANFLNRYPEMDFALEGLKVFANLSGMKSPADFFTVMEQSMLFKKWATGGAELEVNMQASLSLMALLARSLLVVENGESRLIGLESISNYSADTDFYFLYLGFLSQQNLKYYNIFLKNKTAEFKLVDYFNSITKKTEVFVDSKKAFSNILTKAAKNTEKVYKLSSTIKKLNKNDQALRPDSLHAFVESVIDMGEDMHSSVVLLIEQLNLSRLKPGGSNAADTFQRSLVPLSTYFRVARKANDVARDLQVKKFSAAIFRTLDLSFDLQATNDPGAISDVLNLRLSFKNDDLIKAWAVVNTVLAEKSDISSLTKSQKESFALIRPELTRLTVYAKSKAESESLNNFISDLITLSDHVLEAKKDGIHQQLKTFSTTAAFQDFMFTYYLSYNAKEQIDAACNFLMNFKVKNKDAEQRVFTDEEISSFRTLVGEYYQRFFENYFIKGNKDESKDLLLIKTRLSARVKALSVVFADNSMLINPQVAKVMRLVIEIGSAEKEEDIKQSLNNFINKTGSYVDKRKAKFNISVNAYPGILPAYDLAWKPGGSSKAFSVGFTAPVGLGFSWATKSGVTNGFFIPIIDIGALTRVRLDDSNADRALPEFSFKNIFSPGLYYSWGFKNSPLGLNVGMQYGPDLKEVTYDAAGNAVTKSYESLRLGVALVLDIPLFNLTNKPR